MSVSDTIAAGFRATLVAKVLEVGVNGLLILLLTNVFLTTEEYGVLFLGISIFSTAVFLSRLGLPKSAARYVTDYRETNPELVPVIVRRSMLVLMGTIAIVAVCLLVIREQLPLWFDEPALADLVVVGVCFVAAQTLRSYVYFLCQGFNRVEWSAICSIATNLGILVFVVGALSAGGGVVGALVGYTLGYALGGAVGLAVLAYWLWQGPAAWGEGPAEPTPNDSRSPTRRLLEYSLPLSVTGASSILFKRVDIMLVGAFLSPVAVAAYTLAKQLTEFVTAPASSLGFALAPAFGESKTVDERERAGQIFETAFEHVMLFYVPAATGLALVADPAIRHVFGEGYLGAIPIVQVLAAFVVLQAITKLTNDALDFLGRARHRAISKGGAAVGNLLLSVALIPLVGAVGAAIATVCSFAVMAAVNLYLIHVELPVAFSRLARTTLEVCSVAAGMGLVVWLVVPYAASVLTVGAVVAVGLCAWLVLAVGSGLLDLRWAVSQLT